MSFQKKNILLIEPFYKGSHKYWCDKLIEHSLHNIHLFTRNGVFWKWKMVESELISPLSSDHAFDIILGTNMLNMTAWAGQNRAHLKKAKLVSYFHENQLTYPGSDKNEFFGFKNISSAISSDLTIFNSEFHKKSFLNATKALSQKLPDSIDAKLIDKVETTAKVLPIGLECEQIKKQRCESDNEVPLVVWNHRHEEDKNPSLFFETLIELKNDGIPFELAVLGSSPKKPLGIFEYAQDELKENIIHWGRVDSFEEYCRWLWRADIAPTTSDHDFFGISVLEAAFCENHLLLPKKNAYPDHFNVADFKDHYYENDREFKSKLKNLLLTKEFKTSHTSQIAAKYSWEKVIKDYDELLMRI